MIRAAAGVLLSLVVLTGCGGSPTPVPSASSTPVDHSEQSTIDGEWVVTRTVVSSDDVTNPARAVDAVSTRLVLFGDVVCDNGPCTGGVLSGPTQAVRDATTFTSSGDVIRYEFSGFVNCLRQDTGAVLVPNGYAYTSAVELTVIATDEAETTRATTLEGTMTYTDTITDEALAAGCSRDPVTTTTEYALSAVRGSVEPQPSATPSP